MKLKIFSFVMPVLMLLMMSSATAQTARLQVIHNAADVAADPVDIYLNGALLLDDFGFRAATPFIDAPAGVTLNIGVAPGTSSSVNDTLVNFQAMLENGETYVVVANGVIDPGSYAQNPDGKSTAFTLFVKPMARESASGSGVDFFVVHGSTDAPTVDVIARNVATLVDDAAYGDITDYINVPAGAYILDITPGNDNNTIVASFDADLTGLEGGSAVVFASGFLDPSMNQDGEPFGIFAALSDGTVVGFGTVTSNEENNTVVPVEYGLQQNYPNPFNPSTNIQFSIPEQQLVQLKVYNVIGQEVATLVNDVMNRGNYSVTFDAVNYSSGVYFYKLETGKFSEVKKMILTK
jgi:hypothetical protein